MNTVRRQHLVQRGCVPSLVEFDLMNSYIRVPTRAAVFISSSRLDREYESYEHANAISVSELVNTTTLERTINSPSRDRPPRATLYFTWTGMLGKISCALIGHV